LLHERTAVFVDNGQWYLLVYLTCEGLQSDGRCAVYSNRPQVCRDYGTDICEFEENAVYDQFFEIAEQLEEYAEAILGPRSGGSIRSPRPEGVAVQQLVRNPTEGVACFGCEDRTQPGKPAVEVRTA